MNLVDLTRDETYKNIDIIILDKFKSRLANVVTKWFSRDFR